MKRFDEHPLRLVEKNNPGSPFHEFFKSFFPSRSKSSDVMVSKSGDASLPQVKGEA
jgi:hypothetical protein